MCDRQLNAVASAVGGLAGKPGRCFASVTGPQADDTRAPTIALGQRDPPSMRCGLL